MGHGQGYGVDNGRMTNAAPALTLMLFDVDDTLAPGTGGRKRCCRPAASTGMPCMAWPRRDAPACSHHITAAELAVVEQQRPRPNVAA